ncbi:No apical meristem (NAM) protein [Musa troglodytarum]|uniref:No apical meristem (NAM) protein n=1 Tax=Musa troglodytarum TaxID=320322 RepID=A0A9E7HSC4_9LILI|nr:No apical meristem (NAM) protein [Musa troglodytarum]
MAFSDDFDSLGLAAPISYLDGFGGDEALVESYHVSTELWGHNQGFGASNADPNQVFVTSPASVSSFRAGQVGVHGPNATADGHHATSGRRQRHNGRILFIAFLVGLGAVFWVLTAGAVIKENEINKEILGRVAWLIGRLPVSDKTSWAEGCCFLIVSSTLQMVAWKARMPMISRPQLFGGIAADVAEEGGDLLHLGLLIAGGAEAEGLVEGGGGDEGLVVPEADGVGNGGVALAEEVLELTLPLHSHRLSHALVFDLDASTAAPAATITARTVHHALIFPIGFACCSVSESESGSAREWRSDPATRRRLG